MASASAPMTTSSIADELEGWEEYDPTKGTFTTHMVAGSFAGVAEHLVMFPVDTLKVRARGNGTLIAALALSRCSRC